MGEWDEGFERINAAVEWVEKFGPILEAQLNGGFVVLTTEERDLLRAYHREILEKRPG